MQATTEQLKRAEELEAKANRCDQAAEESFQRCDTDGFLSQWASQITARLYLAEAKILRNGGVAEFPALFDLQGNQVKAKLIHNRFGSCWALTDDAGNFVGKFVGAFPKKAATLERKGYREGKVERPAIAVIKSNGKGLSGAATAFVAIVEKTDKGEKEQ